MHGGCASRVRGVRGCVRAIDEWPEAARATRRRLGLPGGPDLLRRQRIDGASAQGASAQGGSVCRPRARRQARARGGADGGRRAVWARVVILAW